MVSQHGQLVMADKLLKAGADAQERGPNGETMVDAGRSGNADLIRLFVKAGADLNVREELRGTTALMWAAEQQNAEAVRALLALGAESGRQVRLGWAAAELFRAAAAERQECRGRTGTAKAGRSRRPHPRRAARARAA